VKTPVKLDGRNSSRYARRVENPATGKGWCFAGYHAFLAAKGSENWLKAQFVARFRRGFAGKKRKTLRHHLAGRVHRSDHSQDRVPFRRYGADKGTLFLDDVSRIFLLELARQNCFFSSLPAVSRSREFRKGRPGTHRQAITQQVQGVRTRAAPNRKKSLGGQMFRQGVFGQAFLLYSALTSFDS